jgi:hypothetical protein
MEFEIDFGVPVVEIVAEAAEQLGEDLHLRLQVTGYPPVAPIAREVK